jgi:hypothetical protein
MVWEDDPTEISNRLGWLHIPEVMVDALPGIRKVVAGVKADGYKNVLLMGMGGSSLAPLVIRETYGVKKGYLDVEVLDSTDPGADSSRGTASICRRRSLLSPPNRGTAETMSFCKYFYNEVLKDRQEGRGTAS